MSEGFSKSERICSERRIDALFNEGRRGGVHPVKYCWRVVGANPEGVGGRFEKPAVGTKPGGVDGRFEKPAVVAGGNESREEGVAATVAKSGDSFSEAGCGGNLLATESMEKPAIKSGESPSAMVCDERPVAKNSESPSVMARDESPAAKNSNSPMSKENRESPVSILVSVPKKAFKRAWKRNLIKRRIRESYRRRKGALAEKAAAAGVHIDIAFICVPQTGKGAAAEIPDFKTIDNAVAKILEQILARS